jgi:hypothetical protein
MTGSNLEAFHRKLIQVICFPFLQCLGSKSYHLFHVSSYGDCADRQDTTSPECVDLKICVTEGTTYSDKLPELFKSDYIVPKQSGELVAQGLAAGDCNAIAGGVIDVSMSNIREVGQYNGTYEKGDGTYSKDPLALVTRQDDPQWSAFVYWIVSAIFYAEEEGITTSTYTQMPVVNLFGTLYSSMLRDAIGAVGSYAEIYDRHVELEVNRSGLNLLNENPLKAQHYPLPGLER